MKETIAELAHHKHLPPSLTDVAKERFGRVTKTWGIEHARVLRAMEQSGVSSVARERVAKIMSAHAKWAGVSAAAADFLIAGTLAGIGTGVLAKSEPLKFTAGIFEFSGRGVTNAVGFGIEAGAAGALYAGPVQQLSRLGARIYGSAVENMINTARIVQDRMRST